MTPTELGLSPNPDIEHFLEETGGGIFQGGLVSVLSVRERIADLGGWETWLPPGARLFASGACGLLYVASGTTVSVVDTQLGNIMRTRLSFAEAVLALCEEDVRTEFLHESVFHLWREIHGDLPDGAILSPTPVLAMGGRWTVTTLSTVSLQVCLSFMAQIFATTSETPIHVFDDDS